MTLRFTAAVAAGKLTAMTVRRLGRGGGTALPGVVATTIDRHLIGTLGARLERGSVLVTGTNGKTTASRVFASMLSAAGLPCVHNRAGSNLLRGIASTLLGSADPAGHLPRGALGLFETDEATLPSAVRALAPRAIAFTNLFRDQLDRYGEVDTVFALWGEALAAAPRAATLILNADDPSVARLADGWSGPVHWFGIEDAQFATNRSGAYDARWCRACGGAFAFDVRYYAHIGLWRCRQCGRERPSPETVARDIRLGPGEACFVVDGLGKVTMPLTGLYNVSNALAGIALARVMSLPDPAILEGLARAEAAFGRQETAVLEGRTLHLLLAKNPAGANQVIDLLASLHPQGAPELQAAILLNDRAADGKDVSWTWDVDFEAVAGSIRSCWVGGDRAPDMALRLKYAGWPKPLATEQRPGPLLDAIVAQTRPGEEIFAVPTYTAMLDLRAELARRGVVSEFWKAAS